MSKRFLRPQVKRLPIKCANPPQTPSKLQNHYISLLATKSHRPQSSQKAWIQQNRLRSGVGCLPPACLKKLPAFRARLAYVDRYRPRSTSWKSV